MSKAQVEKSAKIGGPTPPEVLKAIDVIAKYLRCGGWVEAVVSENGGASFHLTSIFDLVLEQGEVEKDEFDSR